MFWEGVVIVKDEPAGRQGRRVLASTGGAQCPAGSFPNRERKTVRSQGKGHCWGHAGKKNKGKGVSYNKTSSIRENHLGKGTNQWARLWISPRGGGWEEFRVGILLPTFWEAVHRG